MSRAASSLVAPVALALFALFALLPACGEPDGPVIEAPGTGPASERPLWVPRPGPIGPLGAPFAVSEDRLVGGRRVFAAGWQEATEFFESSFGPAEPYFVRLYGRHADGIYLEGDTREGLYDPPILWVPSTVRVGMRWSHPPRWKFEVTGRGDDKGDGQPVAWVIEVTDQERRISNQDNTRVLIGEPYRITYHEGSHLMTWDRANRAQRLEWLAQDEAPPPAEPVEVPALELHALNGGEPIAEGVVPTFFGAVVDPDGDRIDLTVDGLGLALDNSGGISGGGGAGFIGGEANLCGRYFAGADRVADSGDAPEPCRDARATVIDADDRVLRIGNDGWDRYYYCVPGIGPKGEELLGAAMEVRQPAAGGDGIDLATGEPVPRGAILGVDATAAPPSLTAEMLSALVVRAKTDPSLRAKLDALLVASGLGGLES